MVIPAPRVYFKVVAVKTLVVNQKIHLMCHFVYELWICL